MAANTSKQAPALSAFISHAKADAKKASAIAEALESRGFKCWIAPRDVKAGRSYGDEIIRGIESAKAFVLVLSKASNSSPFVAREVERAVSKKKLIFAVRLAAIEPAPSLELFISGTQWIDAFPGRLAPHVNRLADLLAEEQGAPAEPRDRGDDVKPREKPRWLWPASAAAAVLIAVGAGFALWPGLPTQKSREDSGRLITNPVWFPEKEREDQEQLAAAEAERQMAAAKEQMEMAAGAKAPDDRVRIGGSKPAEEDNIPGMAFTSTPLSHGDADFRTCEKSSGDDAVAACDRAIASGKFTGLGLSYLYSDRGFIRMQKGELELALADLDKAAEIDSTNFYAYWNRGAIYAAKGEFERAQGDLKTALALNPDETSKAKIEEALNGVVDIAKASDTPPSDGSVITIPTWGNQEQNAAAAAPAYPADAMPAYPAAEPAYPAAESPMLALPPPSVTGR